jgi:hypothetical protein
MEQLIIFLLFVVGSIISSYIQHKKKQEEERQQRELEDLTRREGSAPSVPRNAPWPKTAADWQEELRRMLEGETPRQPPPVIKPVLLPPVQQQQPPPAPVPQPPPALAEAARRAEHKALLQRTAGQYQRAENLHASVKERLRAVAEQTTTHRSAEPRHHRRAAQSDFVSRLRQHPGAMREAFIASIIFEAPKGLEEKPVDAR